MAVGGDVLDRLLAGTRPGHSVRPRRVFERSGKGALGAGPGRRAGRACAGRAGRGRRVSRTRGGTCPSRATGPHPRRCWTGTSKVRLGRSRGIGPARSDRSPSPVAWRRVPGCGDEIALVDARGTGVRAIRDHPGKLAASTSRPTRSRASRTAAPGGVAEGRNKPLEACCPLGGRSRVHSRSPARLALRRDPGEGPRRGLRTQRAVGAPSGPPARARSRGWETLHSEGARLRLRVVNGNRPIEAACLGVI